MPQNIDKSGWWKTHLGDDWEAIHQDHLHTLGNLTLTGYNSELSNKPFSDKKVLLNKNSRLELNRYFNNVTQWTGTQIEKRAEYLANLALKVWPNFGDGSSSLRIKKNYDISGATPFSVTLQETKKAVNSWKAVMITTLEFLIEKDVDFEDLTENFSGLVSSKTAFKRRAELSNQYYVNLSRLGAEYVRRSCQKLMENAGYSVEDWDVEYHD